MKRQGSKPADVPIAQGESEKKTSRRHLIAGATGGLAVLTAESLARAVPAHAANGDAVTLGQTNTETDLTQIEHTGQFGDAVFKALSSNSAGVPGLIGQSITTTGVRGISTDGDGVFGQSSNTNGVHGVTSSNGQTEGAVFAENSAGGNGVRGTSVSGTGVRGESTGGPQGVLGLGSSGSSGVRGQSDSGYGVFGISTSSVGVSGQTSTSSLAAVLGTNLGGGHGVEGTSTTGDGVVGNTDMSGSGNGVRGNGPIGVNGNGTSYGVFSVGGTAGVHGEGTEGVQGASTSLAGVGVHGSAGGSGTGVWGEALGTTAVGVKANGLVGGSTALQVNGKAVFSRSGILTVPMGSDQATQTGVDLTSASLVLATMQDDRAGNFVRAAVPSVSTSSFTVLLNKKVTSPTKVGWMVVN